MLATTSMVPLPPSPPAVLLSLLVPHAATATSIEAAATPATARLMIDEICICYSVPLRMMTGFLPFFRFTVYTLLRFIIIIVIK